MLRERHRRCRKGLKGAIISELCELLGVCRKQAIRLLNESEVGRPRKPGKRGRPGKYQDKAFKDALRKIWKMTRYPCGRALKSAIPLWLPAIEEDSGAFSPDISERLLAISSPTIDRILKPFKVEKGKCFTRSGGFRDEIPIQGNNWDIGIPGYMETDTAVMCGGSLLGEFVNTLTMVDIATIWTETRTVFGKGSNAVFDAIRDVEHFLPFAILGYDADNGGEVLNRHLYEYFYTERLNKGLPPVYVTRSRAYHKNDNAHVEQRNDTMVRKFLGYERMEYRDLVPLLNHYYAEVVCPLVNHFMPSFKLVDKVKVKSRTRRIYNAPMTPYQRLMDSDYLSKNQKLRLQLIHESLNPVTLSREEVRIRKLIDDCLRSLKAGNGMLPKTPAYSLWMALLPQPTNTVRKNRIISPVSNKSPTTSHIFG
jgi:hypothetical protein